jgi:hypothetical protein
VIVSVVLRFDPPTAVWLAWGISFIGLVDGGLYLHDLLPRYQAGVWVFLSLVWFGGFLYAKQLADRLACPAVEYHGKLLASALPSPDNPCLRKGQHFPPDTVFLFFGPETIYLQKGGREPVMKNEGHVLLTADFDETGLSVTTQIYDAEGTLQATVNDNEFDALSPNICVERPDLSSLTIIDRATKEERLYVHYVNSQAVEFRGLFHYPKLDSVQIKKEAILIGTNSIGENCIDAGMIDIHAGMIRIHPSSDLH